MRKSEETVIILFLGGIAVVCIAGIIALEVFSDGVSSDALLTIGSLCVGALAGRISQQSRASIEPDEDAFEIIGRVATKKMIAEALRNMSTSTEE